MSVEKASKTLCQKEFRVYWRIVDGEERFASKRPCRARSINKEGSDEQGGIGRRRR